MHKDNFLSYYANHFDALELNFGYYKMPIASQFQEILQKTQDQLTFSVLAHKSMTLDRTAGELDILKFKEALKPLIEAKTLGTILLRFPPSFTQTHENRSYLHKLNLKLDLPCVAEFNNRQWIDPPVLEWIKKLGMGFCCVDEPRINGLMPPLPVLTSNTGYLRFHGRNSSKWYNHNLAHERYDYLYSEAELNQWIENIIKMEKQAHKMMIFFNNPYEAKSIDNAKKLINMIKRHKQKKEHRL
jgi:uncharacterized protein YecE (DUF72 family)